MRKSLVTHVTTAVVAFTIALPVSVAVWADEGPPAGAPPAPAAAATDKYSAEELQTLVGPVALYPDVVLSSLMPATSFPDQVAAAAKWLAANPGAKADAAPAEWDNSIKALVEVPDVLKWLGENPEWVQQVGYAVSVQQSELLAAVQEFRKTAQAAGNLKTDEHMSVEGGGTTEAPIVIEPTDPEIIYVPTYEPTQVVTSGYAAPYWGWGAGIAMGALGAWAIHEMNWGGHNGNGSINVNNNVNRTTNVDRNGPNRPTQFQGKAGGQRPAGAVKKPSTKPGGAGKPGGPGGAGKPGGPGGPGGAGKPGGPGGAGKPGGVGGPGGAGKPGGVGGPGGAGKPGGVGGPGGAGKPGGPGGVSRPGGAPSVPGMHPGSPGGAGGGRPAATPSKNPPNHAFGGAGSGQAAQKASNRGGSSMNRSGTPSKSYSGGGRSSGGGGGGSRSGGGGGGRSGGGGGGGRGGGGGGGRRR